MVNLVKAQTSLLHGLMKMAGIKPINLEIEPDTIMKFWVPKETIRKQKQTKPKPTKPVVVLLHGFAADGIFTWQFQIQSLTQKYSVYVPDLLFFGGSTTNRPDRSPAFQAECLAAGLRKLGIEKCILVGFAYGGMIAFKMAEMYPFLVEAVVITSSILAMTESINVEALKSLGFSSPDKMLLPTSVKDLKLLVKLAAHKKIWLPDRFHKDFLEERGELLEGLVVSNKDATIPKLHQPIHLLWGEKDQIFKLEFAHTMKEQLGDNTTYQGIKNAGHLVNLERPCVYNRCLKEFLASLQANEGPK